MLCVSLILVGYIGVYLLLILSPITCLHNIQGQSIFIYAIIPPQRKSISQVKAQLLNPATTSHFQVSVSFQKSEFNRFKQELGLNLDQGRLNILCSDAQFLPGSRFCNCRIKNNIPGVRERHVYRRTYDDTIQFIFLL